MSDLWKHRTFLLKMAAFFAVFWGINLAVSQAYIRWARHWEHYEVSRLGFESQQGSVSIVFLGDSHVANAVYSPYIPGAYNFAFNGESPIESYYKLKHYLDKGWRPDTVVLQFDVHTFSGYRTDRFRDPAFWKQYLNYWELGLVKGRPQTYLKLWLIGEFAYIGSLDEAVYLFLHPPFKRELEAGFTGRKRVLTSNSQAAILKEAATRTEKHFEGNVPLDPDILNYFLRTLDLLESYDIEVVLIRYPVTTWYIDEVNALFSIEEYYQKIDEAIQAQGYQVKILDYHDLFWGQDDLFFDTDHLNGEGAKLFTSKYLLPDLGLDS